MRVKPPVQKGQKPKMVKGLLIVCTIFPLLFGIRIGEKIPCQRFSDPDLSFVQEDLHPVL